jgi:glycosyltransferase involved in cell wall biosynthesis
MRILSCIHGFHQGGVERTALKLCRAWAAHGWDVTLVVGRSRDRARPATGGVRCRHLPRPGIGTEWIETLWMILWLPGHILRLRPDVLFCPGNSYTIVAVAMKLLLGRRCPPIVAKISNDLHRPDLPAPVRRVYHLWCRLQGRMIDRFAALSPAMRGEIAHRMQIPPDRILTVGDAVLDDTRIARLTAARLPAATPPPGRRFLAIGRLVAQKDFASLLSAFALGARDGDRLTLVGDGPERNALRQQAERLGIVDRIMFVRECDAVEARLVACDALLLASRYEGLPAVAVEARIAGVPLIATDSSTSMAALLDGPADRLVPVGDVQAFADAIRQFEPTEIRPDAGHLVRHFRTAPVAARYTLLFAGAAQAWRTGARPRHPIAART